MDVTRKEWENRLADCSKCGSFRCSSPIIPRFNKDAECLIQTSRPGVIEVAENSILTKNSMGGRYILSYIREMGLTVDQVYVTPTQFCALSVVHGGYTESILNCKEWKKYEYAFLERVKGVVILGNSALQQLLGENYPSSATVLGAILQDTIYPGVPVMVLPHPGFSLRRKEQTEEVRECLREFGGRCGFTRSVC